MYRKKNRLYKKYLRKPTEKNKNIYKTFKNKYVNDVKKEKRNYYTQKFNAIKNNLGKTWKMINDLLNKKGNHFDVDNIDFCENGDIINDKNDIVNGFNEYFINVGQTLNNVNTQPIDNMYMKYFTEEPLQSTLFLKPVTEKEIIEIACSLENGKSPGIDCIDNYVVKSAIHILCKPLCHIFNLCFQKGIFPTSCKISKVIPVHKGGAKNVYSNYRPISLLTCFSKVLEKCIYTRFINFFDFHQILYNKQFGFCEKHYKNTCFDRFCE